MKKALISFILIFSLLSPCVYADPNGGGINIAAYPESAFEGAFSAEDGRVIVSFGEACKLGYLEGGKYISLSCVPGDGGSFVFDVPEGISDLVLVVAGDTGLDGKLTNADATKIKAALKGGAELSLLQKFAADANHDGKLSNADATKTKAALKGALSIAWDFVKVDFNVEYYLQTEAGGSFELCESMTDTMKGDIEQLVTVSPKQIPGYVFDAGNEDNVLSGIASSDGSLVLKLRYKLDADGNSVADDEDFYTVTFLDENGTAVLGTVSCQWGCSVDFADEPIVNKDSMFFTGWVPEPAEVTGDLTCRATYGPADEYFTFEYIAVSDGYRITPLKYALIDFNKIAIPASYEGLPVLRLTGFKNLTFPEEVRLSDRCGVGTSAFENCQSLRRVITGNNMTGIGEKALYNCRNLVSFDIPDSVMRIGSYAFHNCVKLESIHIPSSLTWMGEYVFYGCESAASSIVIPEGLERIQYRAFDSCRSITDITLSDHVRYIKDDAFYMCVSVRNISLGNNVYEIGQGAFEWCDIESITLPDSLRTLEQSAFSNCKKLKSIAIPYKIKMIENSLLSGCESLESVTFADDITKIGSFAFRGCSSLREITVPETVTSIGNSAFRECESLVSVNIPDQVNTVESWLFFKCTSLRSIALHEGITLIDISAFRECTSLESIDIPDSVTKIDLHAFAGCTSLAEVTLGSGIKTIGRFAFQNCVSLPSISIPQSVTSIEKDVFSGCTELEDIYYAGTMADWESIADAAWNDGTCPAVIHCSDGNIQN